MTTLVTVSANTIEFDEDYQQEVVSDDESLILGQFKENDLGIAFVKALRLSRFYDEHEVFTAGFTIYIERDNGTTDEFYATHWGDCKGNWYYDLCIVGEDGYIFWIAEEDISKDNAFEIVWTHSREEIFE